MQLHEISFLCRKQFSSCKVMAILEISYFEIILIKLNKNVIIFKTWVREKT